MASVRRAKFLTYSRFHMYLDPVPYHEVPYHEVPYHEVPYHEVFDLKSLFHFRVAFHDVHPRVIRWGRAINLV